MTKKAPPPQVIGIASGKGGVGKTTVAINLAVALQQQGYRVMLLDADLGLANAQIALGCKTPYNLGHLLRGEKTLAETITTTPQGIRLVPGASGLRELAGLDIPQVASIINAFSELDEPVDYLIVDLAPGITEPVVAFMAACQRRFVVVTDQPASIADAYGLIKVMAIEEELDEIYLIPNIVPSQADGQRLFKRLNELCNLFLHKSIKPLPAIETDELIQRSQRKYQSVLEFAPGSSGSRDFRRLAQTVAKLTPIRQASGRVQFFMERMLEFCPKI